MWSCGFVPPLAPPAGRGFLLAEDIQPLRHGGAVPPSPQGEGLERANTVCAYCLKPSAYCLNPVRIFRNMRLIDVGETFTHMLTVQRSVAQIHKACFKERFKFRPDSEIHCDGILKNRVFNDAALLRNE